MINIFYLISDTLTYNRLICDDAGPGYAYSMQWTPITIKNFRNPDSKDIYVIDNRISIEETIELTQIFISNPAVNFILKIVDPLLENFNHFYYIWVCKMIRLENIRLLSVYEAKELTYYISQVSNKPIIYAPYPYDHTKEVTLKDLANRSNKIIISGSINYQVYPFRSEVWLKSRRSLSRLIFDVLKHPGYAEVSNQDFNHNYTRENFIKYLTNYKYMLLCGSRCDVELLKFHECAYAGCLPVGKYPSCFPEEIQKIFYPLRSKNLFTSALKYLFSWNSTMHQEKITIYRDYLRANRSPSIINAKIISQL